MRVDIGWEDKERIDTLVGRLREEGMHVLAMRVAAEHGVSLFSVLTRDNHRRTVEARHHLIAIIRWSTSLSYPEIGRLMGLDHSTVMSAEKSHEARITDAMRMRRSQ